MKEVKTLPEQEIERQEILDVCEGMQRFGGSFVKNLGKALLLADSENTKKIKTTWPKIWKRYLSFGRSLREDGEDQ